jgi:hypothetical protein
MTTSPPIAQPATTGTQPRDLRKLWRILFAVVLPIGPLGVTVLRGMLPYWTDQDGRTIVQNSANNLDTLNAMLWIGMFVISPLLLGMLILGYVARRGSPVLATLGAGISFVSYAGWGASPSSDFVVYLMAKEGYGVDAINAFVEALYAHPVSVITGFGWVVGHILGMVLLGIALAKSGVVARWVGAALAVSQPIHLVSAIILPSKLLDVTLGWGLTAVGFAMVSVAVLRMSDDEFDLPPGLPTRRV